MNVMDRGFGREAALDPESNCTLEMYAAAKVLPVGFLNSLGLADHRQPVHPRAICAGNPIPECGRPSASQAHTRRSN